MSSTDVLAIVCLAAVVLTPPRRSRRISRIQWSTYTEREATARSPRSAYVLSKIGVSPAPMMGTSSPAPAAGLTADRSAAGAPSSDTP